MCGALTMANHCLALDSRQRSVGRQSKTMMTIVTYLALSSFLISAHCASSVKTKWPDYSVVYSPEERQESSSLDELIGRAYRQSQLREPTNGQLRLPQPENNQPLYYLSPPIERVAQTSPAPEDTDLLRQLVLARHQQPQQNYRDQSVDNSYMRPNSLGQMYEESDDPDSAVVLDESAVRDQLAQLLGAKKLSSLPTINNVDDDDNDNADFDQKHGSVNNPTAPLFFLADQLTQDGRGFADEGNSKDIYQVETTGGNLEVTSEDAPLDEASKKSVLVDTKDNQRNFTTMLEDEPEMNTTIATTTTASSVSGTTPEQDQAESSTSAPSQPQEQRQQQLYPTYEPAKTSSINWYRASPKMDAAGDNSWSAMFGRVYNSVASYMPSMSWLWPATGHGGKSDNGVSIVKISEHNSMDEPRFVVQEDAVTKPSVSVTKIASNEPSVDHGLQAEATTNNSSSSSSSEIVDTIKADDKLTSLDDEQKTADEDNTIQVAPVQAVKVQSESVGDAKVAKVMSKLAKLSNKMRQHEQVSDKLSSTADEWRLEPHGDIKISYFSDDDGLSAGTSKRRNHEPKGQVKKSLMFDDEDDYDSSKDNERKVSLLRQSSVAMPYKSSDELLMQSATNGQPAESLLGRYIYAPEHHYHLSAVMHEVPRKPGTTTTLVVDSDDQPAMPPRAYMRHMRPQEDNGIFGGPFGGLRAMYGPSERLDGKLGGVNQTNDLYFLVMVGAFCVVAMVAVLSAGLFAYRVQQSRKSTPEPEYPTYGVVGPNNMNGKCGAAAFMGGYFGAGRPASSSGSSVGGGKSVGLNSKHLGDGPFSDGTASTINVSKANKRGNNIATELGQSAGNIMANQNAARMYHYQHQKQQMIISDRASAGRHTSASDLDSEDENDDGSYTVYECPGLASAHEMEIKNPLFNDDQSP